MQLSPLICDLLTAEKTLSDLSVPAWFEPSLTGLIPLHVLIKEEGNASFLLEQLNQNPELRDQLREAMTTVFRPTQMRQNSELTGKPLVLEQLVVYIDEANVLHYADNSRVFCDKRIAIADDERDVARPAVKYATYFYLLPDDIQAQLSLATVMLNRECPPEICQALEENNQFEYGALSLDFDLDEYVNTTPLRHLLLEDLSEGAALIADLFQGEYDPAGLIATINAPVLTDDPDSHEAISAWGALLENPAGFAILLAWFEADNFMQAYQSVAHEPLIEQADLLAKRLDRLRGRDQDRYDRVCSRLSEYLPAIKTAVDGVDVRNIPQGRLQFFQLEGQGVAERGAQALARSMLACLDRAQGPAANARRYR
ncbi:MAG: hypothetical protein DHS20C10_13290 [marine bacterium B5-7]|nr:MAG: hypothetical protein DHS20C10_13290 [marine bacterium B5-7]